MHRKEGKGSSRGVGVVGLRVGVGVVVGGEGEEERAKKATLCPRKRHKTPREATEAAQQPTKTS